MYLMYWNLVCKNQCHYLANNNNNNNCWLLLMVDRHRGTMFQSNNSYIFCCLVLRRWLDGFYFIDFSMSATSWRLSFQASCRLFLLVRCVIIYDCVIIKTIIICCIYSIISKNNIHLHFATLFGLCAGTSPSDENSLWVTRFGTRSCPRMWFRCILHNILLF